ncbi:MAG: serine/threonine protein kinase, partial [Ktedonobacteraceae bacterium]|nr:serine/threonine protein kinase [Ktedonobacteraceae bacterium]
GDFPTSGGVHTDRFLREALLLARLEHPAIPTLYDYFTQDGYWYLVMDYVPGPTLGTYLRQQPALPPLEALNYAMQLCDVLDYLHRQSPPIVFRDMKPSNIILTPEKALMLVDFGISRYFKVGQVNDTIEFGSPGYAPPEQYQGHAQTDARSDLYSLGVLLHEMVTGKRPVGMGAPLSPPQSINPNLSAAISGLIALATRSEPMYRFQSAQALYLALERVYTIEEWRAYQQQLQHSQEDEKVSVAAHVSSLGVKFEDGSAQGEDSKKTINYNIPPRPTYPPPPSQPLISPWSINLQQRHAIRRTIQRARQERQEREQHQPPLTLRAETASVTLPQPPVAVEEQPVAQAPSRPSTIRTERIVQVCFALAMVLFLILSAVFTIVHLQQQSDANSKRHAKSKDAGATQVWKVLPS